MMKKYRHGDIDQVAITLMSMSDAEFKRRYMEPRRMTPEDAWNRRALPMMDDEESSIEQVSSLAYIRTWQL